VKEGVVARLLAIDDEMPVLIVLNALFKASGFEVVTSQGGQHATDLINAGGFDIVVSDIRMNPINGIEFLKMSKAVHPETAVLMISAYEAPAALTQLKEMGAFAFVKKPFDNNDLLRLVRKAIDKAPSKPTPKP
jgi:DNA-binding NtrC family response regulator